MNEFDIKRDFIESEKLVASLTQFSAADKDNFQRFVELIVAVVKPWASFVHNHELATGLGEHACVYCAPPFKEMYERVQR